MNPGKWKVNLNHHIFMLYKSMETCHPVSLPCKGTSILIFATCGKKFLPAGMICTTTDTISVIVGFSTLTRTSSIPMGAINVSAWNLFLASVAKLVLWQLMILLPCTLAHTSSIPMGAINFTCKNIFFTRWMITAIFTVLTEVWPRANRAITTQIIHPC